MSGVIHSSDIRPMFPLLPRRVLPQRTTFGFSPCAPDPTASTFVSTFDPSTEHRQDQQ
jgi:hypothetical protein